MALFGGMGVELGKRSGFGLVFGKVGGVLYAIGVL